MAKVPDSSSIPRSFLSKGLAVFFLYILSISSASANLITGQNLGTNYFNNKMIGDFPLCHSSANWLYFIKEHEGKAALYDYSTESFYLK